ncbi:uncharacterized protein LOC115245603 [Formica exsecta]|uniref:uncharacterized protein LOC115245603 n=1 Tax=Formica exsecta TaxID=72781 RepID=UPI00114205D5|nr:uncharacterized protein LOC115245603 [Formica exsecta]
MHALGLSAILLLCHASITVTYPMTTTMTTTMTEVVHETNAPTKCCVADYAFDENLKCIHVELNKFNYTTHDAWQTISSEPLQQIVTMFAFVPGLSCRVDDADTNRHPVRGYATFLEPKDYCIENMINGTIVLIKCTEMALNKENWTETMMVTKTTMIITVTAITTITTMANMTKEDREENVHHNNNLRTVFFWGAQTYMDTNVAHVILCIIVVVVYLSVPKLGKSIYNRAVLRHNVCLLLQGCILMFLGFCELCNCPMSDDFATFLWIVLQYFTNATVFWLNVICFDMTLSITRFRWMVGFGQQTNQEENRRLLLYGVFAWGSALIPAIVAFILEFFHGIPDDFPLKPNYRRYRGGPNLVVNIYFFGIPLLTLFWNNVLFVFTTYKIIRIQQSTEIATRNNTNALKKKYFLFLQLYLLMGAPWFFGLLFACLNKLVVLKICRMIWPILWLLMLATHKKMRQKLASSLRCITKKRETTATNT